MAIVVVQCLYFKNFPRGSARLCCLWPFSPLQNLQITDGGFSKTIIR